VKVRIEFFSSFSGQSNILYPFLILSTISLSPSMFVKFSHYIIWAVLRSVLCLTQNSDSWKWTFVEFEVRAQIWSVMTFGKYSFGLGGCDSR
jgi:hypothetical protein